MWAPVVSAGARATFSLRRGAVGGDDDSESAAHGARFQRVTHAGGLGGVGVANYGLNCQHGMSLRAGKPYEGFTMMRARGDAAFNATISLHDWEQNVTLASQSVLVPAGADWQRVPLALTPSADTTCSGARSSTRSTRIAAC